MRLSKQYFLWSQNISKIDGKSGISKSFAFVESLDWNHFGISKNQAIYKLRDFTKQDDICHSNYCLQGSPTIDLLWHWYFQSVCI